MREPHELMATDYKGPSKVINLGQIQNRDGFKFIGIDKHGGEHYCIVRKGDGRSFYMSSNTVVFQDLCGWLPDPAVTPNAELIGPRTLADEGSRSTVGLGGSLLEGEP